jgi:Amt family ammonium transporter
VAVTFGVVFVLSMTTFLIIKATIGVRVDAEEEEAGLDIAEHGMYGYPEQFIPQSELEGYGAAPAPRPVTVPAGAGAYATTATKTEVPAT